VLVSFAALVLLVTVAACDADLQTTPVIIFPTPIPPGQVLPTFDPGGGGFPVVSTPIPGQPTPFPTLPPAVASLPAQPTTPAPPAAITWNAVRSGVEWASTLYRSSSGANVSVMIVRLAPSAVTFRVHYAPGQAPTIRQWQQALPNAVAIVNGNFFTPENNALGLVVTDGRPFGVPTTRNDAGMFIVSGGSPRVRSNWIEPIQPGEQFEQAAQAWPILIASQGAVQGAVAPINPDLAQVNAPRTVIAQDRLGRILFIVTPFSNTTLGDLAAWLGASGLQLSFALNMDGGTSTNLFVATGGPSQWTQSLRGVPVVIAAYPR
jgi:hypothetical protein